METARVLGVRQFWVQVFALSPTNCDIRQVTAFLSQGQTLDAVNTPRREGGRCWLPLSLED